MVLTMQYIPHFQVSQLKIPETQDDEFIEIQSETGTAFQRFMVRHLTLVKQVC